MSRPAISSACADTIRVHDRFQPGFPGVRFDVRHVGLPIARWRYDIVCDDDGCRVTERTWDRRPGWFSRTAWIGTGVRDRGAANAEHIELTLRRLKEKAEAG